MAKVELRTVAPAPRRDKVRCGPADLERNARQLGRARSAGAGWDCLCPSHDDHAPSLNLKLGDDGRLLWHCRAGCSQGDVLAAMRRRGVLPNGGGATAEGGVFEPLPVPDAPPPPDK